MKVKVLAPHQTVNNKEVSVGEEVEVADSQARQLVQAGYAREIEEFGNAKAVKEGSKK